MHGWRPADISQIVQARSGGGGVWEYHGELVAMGSGRVLAGVHGVEEVVRTTRMRRVPAGTGLNRRTRPLALPGSSSSDVTADRVPVTHAAGIVTCKTLFYTDRDTGARMSVFRYRPTAPPRPVFPVLTDPVELDIALDKRGRLVYALGHFSPRSERLTISNPPRRPLPGLLAVSWTYVLRSTALASPKAPNRPTAIEDYYHVVGKDGGALSWVRVGNCPSWYGGGQCMMTMRGTRVKGGRRALDKTLSTWMASVGRGKPLRVEDAAKAAADRAAEAAKNKSRRKLFGIF